MSTNKITVEVAYATPQQQRILSVEVDANSTIQEIIEASGLLTLFPHIDLAKQKIGVFGKQRELTDMVAEGDRIEVYRSLIIDPKEARRAKAKKSRPL